MAKVVDDSEYAIRVTSRNVRRFMGMLTSKATKMVLELGPDSCMFEITSSYMATLKF